MDHETKVEGGTVTVRLLDRITFKDHEAFKVLARRFDEGVQLMVLDLTAATFIDSAGIGMLLILHDAAVTRGASFRVRGATGQVLRVFTATSIAKALTLEE